MQFKAFCKTHNFLKPESIHPYVQLSKKKTCPKYVFISIIVLQGPQNFPLWVYCRVLYLRSFHPAFTHLNSLFFSFVFHFLHLFHNVRSSSN